jgi:hypothetical protein
MSTLARGRPETAGTSAGAVLAGRGEGDERAGGLAEAGDEVADLVRGGVIDVVAGLGVGGEVR